jgi:integrase
MPPWVRCVRYARFDHLVLSPVLSRNHRQRVGGLRLKVRQVHAQESLREACRAAAIPLWSPHDLRHRRISLLHAQGRPWARIGEWVGQRNLAVTANTYTHVLTDEAELDYAALLPTPTSNRPRTRKADE